MLSQLAAYLDKWIEEQIIKYDDRKWGSRVSQKLFMDREYVVKHIRNKHKDKIDEQKQKVCAHRILTELTSFPICAPVVVGFSDCQHS